MADRKPSARTDANLLLETARSMDAGKRAVIATDPAGIIRYWSRGAAAVFGWNADEVIGRNIVDITPATKGRPEAAHILKNLRSGEDWSGRFELRHRDGSRFTAHVADTPVYNRDGKLIGIVGVTTVERGPPPKRKTAD